MLEAAALVLLSATWLIPNHYPPWSSFYNESCAALALSLLAASVGRRWLRQRVASTAGVVALVAMLPVAQWLTGQIGGGDALVSCLYVSGFAVAIAVGELWAHAAARVVAIRLSGALLFGSVISAGLALIQIFEPFSLGIYGLDTHLSMRAYANLGQPNNLATAIGIGLVGLFFLYEAHALGPVASGVVTVVLLLGISVTQSRTALLFGPLFMAGLLVARSRRIRLQTPVHAVLIATALHWAMAVLWPLLQKAMLLAPAMSLADRGIESIRFQVWPMLLDAATQRPWGGFGWLNVGEAEMAVVDAYPPVGQLWLHSHNLFIDLIVWCGFPVGIALSLLAVYWFVSRIMTVDRIESVAALLVVAVVGTHSLLELPHHYAYFLIPVGLWMGQVENGRVATSTVNAHWLLPPVLLGSVLVLGIWNDYPAIEEDFRLVRFQNLSIGTVRPSEPAPDAPLLSGLTEFLRFSRTMPAANMTRSELDRMEVVVKRTPYSGVMLRYAIALSLNGRLPEARMLMFKARQIHGTADYAKLRRDLGERIATGQSSLIPLFEAMPSE